MKLEQSKYLGTTVDKYDFDSYILSIVDFHAPASEEWHYHENTHFSLVLQGGSRESRKSEDFELSAGKIILYNEGELHCNRHTAYPSKHLIVELKKSFHGENQLDAKRFSKSNMRDLDTHLNLLNIYNELYLGDIYSPESIDFSFNQLLSSPDDSTHIPVWMEKLKEVISDRWDEFISLDDLSKMFNVHPVTVSKYFKKYFGCTLGDYMRKVKLEKAIYFLLHTKKPIAEISDFCGFSDQSHMIKLFKNYIGFLPTQIRAF